MDLGDAGKASNALVTVVEFYAGAVGSLGKQLGEARELVARLSQLTQEQAAKLGEAHEAARRHEANWLALDTLVRRHLEALEEGSPKTKDLRRDYDRVRATIESGEPGGAAAAPAAGGAGGAPRRAAAKRPKRGA